MRRNGFRFAILVAIVTVAVTAIGMAQTADGPYIVVDSAAALPRWGHVFRALTGPGSALAWLSGLPPEAAEEMTGATIVIYPGTYLIGATAVISTPDLRIVSRDGADRTILQARAGLGAAVLNVTAPGVHIEDITVSGGAANAGIVVSGRDCTLKDVLVTGIAGPGIQVLAGADGLTVESCESIGNTGLTGDGFVSAAVWDITIRDSSFRSNARHGINLGGAQRSVIADTTSAGNGANGVLLGADSADIHVVQCDLSNNITGIGNVPGAAVPRLVVTGNTFTGNVGPAINLVNASASVIDQNAFSQNTGTAIAITGPSTGVSIVGNTIAIQAGVPFPASGINLTGAVSGCTVSGNIVSGYNVGITLLGPAPGPSSNLIEANQISETTGDGIVVLVSKGANVFQGNLISDCNGNGLNIAAGVNDTYAQNEISSCTLSGINVSDGGPAGINQLVLDENSVSGCGGNGVTLNGTTGGGGIANVTIRGNVVKSNDKAGLAVNQAFGAVALTGLRIEGNSFVQNEGDGIAFGLAINCSIEANVIMGNLALGIRGVHAPGRTRILRNAIYYNLAGGINLGLGGAVGAVVEENAIFSNQGFGVNLTALPVPPLTSPYTHGFSLASNWWGEETGPAGLFRGSGNAVLGVPGGAVIALAPILPAPIHSGVEGIRILEKDQISVMKSFAATKVEINRLDSAGVRLIFSEVESRASGWASTAKYTSEAVSSKLAFPDGRVVSAVAILLAGFESGSVEISLGYDPADLGDANPEELLVFAYDGGDWLFDEESGVWLLEGGDWVPLTACAVPGANLIASEIPVIDLLGEIKAIALVQEGVASE